MEWHPGAAVVVVLAAEGYPAAPVKGDTITIMSAERSWPSRPGHPDAPSGEAASRSPADAPAATAGMRGGWYRRDIAAGQ